MSDINYDDYSETEDQEITTRPYYQVKKGKLYNTELSTHLFNYREHFSDEGGGYHLILEVYRSQNGSYFEVSRSDAERDRIKLLHVDVVKELLEKLVYTDVYLSVFRETEAA